MAKKPDKKDARRRETGTSLNAKGSTPVPPGALNEIGSSTPTSLRDVVPALVSRQSSYLTYERMTSNDAAVDVSMRAGKAPVMGADFFVQPYSGETEDLEISEFVRFNLLEGMTIPFLTVMDDILRMYEYGHSLLEPVFENRQWSPTRSGANRRNYTMLRKLAIRHPTTIKEYLYDDNGGPAGVVQTAIDASGATKDVEIPIEKLIIFTLNKRGGDITGKSLLRTSYKHWYYKDHLYKIDAIQKERHALGIPFVNLPPGFNSDDKEAAIELVKNVRANEEAGFVIPPGYEMGFARPEGGLVNVMQSVEHHNGMIMLNVMTQFLLLGIQDAGGGGRATSGSHQNMYEKSLRSVGQLICQAFNLYLIPKLVGYNFDTDRFPKMQVRNIGEGKDIQMWASAMSNLISQEAITMDLDTEQWIRAQADMPLKLEDRPAPKEEPARDAAPNRDNGHGPTTDKGGIKGETTGNIGKLPDEG